MVSLTGFSTLVPELSYDVLAIGNGVDASAAFYNLKNEIDLGRKKTTREALLEYCKLYTLVIVKLLDKRIILPKRRGRSGIAKVGGQKNKIR